MGNEMSSSHAGAMLAKVRALGPIIEAHAAGNELATQIADEVVELLRSAGVFALMVPRELGGSEAPPDVLIDVIRELSYHDGSTGWYAGAVMTAGAVSGACLGSEAIAALYPASGPLICAGQAAPTGRAERVAGGYRISGKFSFGSGCPAAAYLVGGYVVHADGAPVMGRHGQPMMLIGFAPRETVSFLGNWHVLGLRGTGSYDFEVADQILHEDFFIEVAAPTVRRGGTLYRMGFMALPALTHASFALGCGRRMLDEWAAFARTKQRAPGQFVHQTQTFQRDFAVAHAEQRAAEAYVRRSFATLFEAADQGHTISDDMKLDGRLSASHALATAARIAQTAFASTTTSALRNGNALQRCFRDIHAGNAHFLTSEQSFIDAGKVLGGVEGASVIF